MKSKLLTLLIGVLLTGCSEKRPAPAIPSDPEMEAKIENLLKKMTLEEKIGQMCELTIGVVTDKSGDKLSEALLDTVIGKYKVGSLLNIPFGEGQNKEVFVDVITQIQKKSLEELGIPCLYGLDQIHGASYTCGATFFPQEINLAAAFNRELTKRCAEITAYETRACCVPWTFAPVMDLGRNPVWPRMWESYGEDAYVNAEMGVQAVEGLQGPDPNNVDQYHIASCIKHFMGYGVPVSGQDRTPSSITDIDMREKYFAPFLAAIRAGALSLMVNSANNSGVAFHANKELLTGWLKNDLNWDGMIVTDWNDINNLYSRDHIATSKKDAVRIAINAGIDMAMIPSEAQFCIDLKELVEEGAVSMERIDDAVRRILRLKFRLGLFEKPYWDTNDYPLFGSQEFAEVALQAATESEVLLKNDNNLLPLSKNTRILLTGPNANAMRCLNGGWSYSWQGELADKFAGDYNTIYEAMCNKFGSKNIVYQPGVTYSTEPQAEWSKENAPEISKAVAAAANVDVIVACIGENSYCETPGNLNDLNLSTNQSNLVKALAKTGKPLILVLNEGRPRLISDIEPLAAAVIDIMLPGNYGGDALADLIAGDANFSGRMPFTYPRHINSFATYDYKPCQQMETMAGEYNYDAVMDIQWPFGYGLSYTTFAYSGFKVNHQNFNADTELVFEIDVTNTGNMVGKETVMLYSSDIAASVSPDVIRLRNFTKVELKPGETKHVVMTLRGSDLAFVGQDGKWTIENGDFRIRCGSEILMLHCDTDKVWETPNID